MYSVSIALTVYSTVTCSHAQYQLYSLTRAILIQQVHIRHEEIQTEASRNAIVQCDIEIFIRTNPKVFLHFLLRMV